MRNQICRVALGMTLALALATATWAQPVPAPRPIGETQTIELTDTALIERPMLWAEQVFQGTVDAIDAHAVIRIRTAAGNVRVRLARLEMPSPEHPQHQASVDAVRDALLQRRVEVLVERRPSGEEPGSARLVSEGRDLREPLVRQGLVWFCAGPRDEPALLRAQGEAQGESKGVWSHEQPQPRPCAPHRAG